MFQETDLPVSEFQKRVVSLGPRQSGRLAEWTNGSIVIESMVVRFRRFDYSPLFSVLMLTELDVLPMPARKTTCPSSRAAARLARTWLRGSVTSLKKKKKGGGGGGGGGCKTETYECNVQSGRTRSYRNLPDIINKTATNLNWVIAQTLSSESNRK